MIYDEIKIRLTLKLTRTSWSCLARMTKLTVILIGMPELLVHFTHLSIIAILLATHHMIQCKLTLDGYVGLVVISLIIQAGKQNGYIDSASYLAKILEHLGSSILKISSMEFISSQLLHLAIPWNICCCQ
jgi:hypothetical protein